MVFNFHFIYHYLFFIFFSCFFFSVLNVCLFTSTHPFSSFPPLSSPDAHLRLGDYYYYGKGVEKDYSMSLSLYRFASDNDVAQVLFVLPSFFFEIRLKSFFIYFILFYLFFFLRLHLMLGGCMKWGRGLDRISIWQNATMIWLLLKNQVKYFLLKQFKSHKYQIFSI